MTAFDFQQGLKTVWRWRWTILAAVALSVATGFLVTKTMTPVYTSTTTLMVGQFLDRERPSAQDLMVTERLAETYAHLVKRESILKATVAKLNLPGDWRELSERVQAVPQPRTQILEIQASDSDPERARSIADEIASQLIAQSPTGMQLPDEDHQAFLRDQLARMRGETKVLQQQLDSLEKEQAQAKTAQAVQALENRISPLRISLSDLRKDYVDAFALSQKQEQTNYLSVVESAFVPRRPASPKLWLNLLLAGLGGLLLAALGVLLFEYLDDHYRSPQEIEKDLDVSLMATVSRFNRDGNQADPFVESSWNGRVGEEFRMLRANLVFTRYAERSNIVQLTSAGPGEGKTTSAINLASAIARGGKRVLLVDADLRRAGLSRVSGLVGSRGLSTLLVEPDIEPSEVITATSIDRLSVLPSGPIPPNPVELLESVRMKERMDQLMKLADTIIIDSPPVLALADAAVLASLIGNVLFIVDADTTQRRAARQSREALSRAGAHVLGIVLNRYETGFPADYYDYSVQEQKT